MTHCVDANKLKPFDSLQLDLGPQRLFSFWTYHQMHNYVYTSSAKHQFLRPTTPFEHTCLSRNPLTKSTSLMYSWLQGARDGDPHGDRAQWEKTLQMSFTDEQWWQASIFAHKCSTGTRIQEMSYKLLTH